MLAYSTSLNPTGYRGWGGFARKGMNYNLYMQINIVKKSKNYSRIDFDSPGDNGSTV